MIIIIFGASSSIAGAAAGFLICVFFISFLAISLFFGYASLFMVWPLMFETYANAYSHEQVQMIACMAVVTLTTLIILLYGVHSEFEIPNIIKLNFAANAITSIVTYVIVAWLQGGSIWEYAFNGGFLITILCFAVLGALLSVLPLVIGAILLFLFKIIGSVWN